MSLNPRLIGLLPGEEKRLTSMQAILKTSNPFGREEKAMDGSCSALQSEIPEESNEFVAGGSSRCFSGGGALDVRDRLYVRELEAQSRAQEQKRNAADSDALEGFHRSRASTQRAAPKVRVTSKDSNSSRKRVRATALLAPSFRRRPNAQRSQRPRPSTADSPQQSSSTTTTTSTAAAEVPSLPSSTPCPTAADTATTGTTKTIKNAAAMLQCYSSSSSDDDD